MAFSLAQDGLRGILAGVLKLVVSLVLAASAYYVVSWQTSSTEKAARIPAPIQPLPSASPVKKVPGAETRSNALSKAHHIPGTTDDFEKAIPAMKETSDLLMNWAIVLFGGTIGIAVLAKGAKIRDGNWGLVLVPPTWVLLYASLFHGSQFKGMLTHQLVRGQYVFRELNVEMFLQREFFEYSLMSLALLAMWYLLFRFAQMEQSEDRGKRGDSS